MPLSIYQMNVVILGRWNRAILTPAGIGKRLFQVPDGTPLSIEVPLDGLGPFKVRGGSKKVVVMADGARLTAEVEDFRYETLNEAMRIGVRAMESLPETPVSAAGVNVNFRTTEPTPYLDQVLESPMDSRLSEGSHEIKQWQLTRCIAFKDGRLNLAIVSEPTKGYQVRFNFDRQSASRNDLIKWLQMDPIDIRDTVGKMAEEELKVELEYPSVKDE